LVWYFGNGHCILTKLLYEVQPFSQLLPNHVAFRLPARDLASRPKDVSAGNPQRINSKVEYLEFKNGVFQEMNGTGLVEQHNANDMEVYRFGVELFCERVRDSGLMDVVEEASLSHHFQRCTFTKTSSSLIER
jgi:hypothetical protein